MKTRDFNELRKRVLKWADERKLLDAGNTQRQALKMVSEIGELCDAIAKNDAVETIDAIGDSLVTIIILSKQLGYDPLFCLKMALQQIENRTGETKNGIFIKDE